MTIIADKSEYDLLGTTIQTLRGLLMALPVDVTINRLYIADNNKEVTLNFSHKKRKYALRVNKSHPNKYVYYLLSTRFPSTSVELTLDDQLLNQITDLIK